MFHYEDSGSTTHLRYLCVVLILANRGWKIRNVHGEGESHRDVVTRELKGEVRAASIAGCKVCDEL